MKKICTFLILLCMACAIPIYATSTLKIKITGIQNNILKNVNKRLEAHKSRWKKRPTQAKIQRFFRAAPKQIKLAMQPFGYFQPTITSQLKHEQNTWIAYFQIDKGPVVRIVQVDIKLIGPGQYNHRLQHFLAHHPLKISHSLNIQIYNKTKDKLYSLASSQGYFKAKMESSHIYINRKTLQARIKIRFFTGPRYRFGATHFSVSPFSQKFLRRYLNYKQGEPFNNNKLSRLQQGLASSGYFSQVAVTPEITQITHDEVPIQIRLKLLNSRLYSYGLGYGTDTGVRGIVGYEKRWTNAYGHSFNTSLRVAQIVQNLVASYSIPGRHPATNQYKINAQLSNQNSKLGEGRSGSVGVSYITMVKGWRQTTSLTSLHEKYNLADTPFITTNLLIPSIQWQRLRSNNALKPSHGYSITLMLSGAHRSFISETSFLQARLQTKFLLTFARNNRLLLRATVAHTAIDNLNHLPLTLQLFAGGTQSIRGYAYQALGPGNNLYVGSIELQRRIKGDWYLTAFYDAGNVSNKMFGSYKQGVGPGIMWLSPVGALELDLARPLNGLYPWSRYWRVQFSMGTGL